MGTPAFEGFRGLVGLQPGADGVPFRASYFKFAAGTIKSGTPVILSASGNGNAIQRVALTLGVNNVQSLTFTGTVSGGSFTLSVTTGGVTAVTAAIAWNATAIQVQMALELLSNVGAGNVTVTGGPAPGTPFAVTFTNYLGSRVIPVMVRVNSLTGSTPEVVPAEVTAGVQGRISSTAFFAFSNDWETDASALGDPATGGYGYEFGHPPANTDGPFWNSPNPINVEPIANGKLFMANIAHDIAVTNAMVGTTYDIGYNLTRDDFFINTGTTVNPLALITRVVEGQLGLKGGLVEFVMPAAAVQQIQL